jgi:protein involved in polysaccharide export with SLBB domain
MFKYLSILALASSVVAQSPTPQQVQQATQAIQSGVQVTPEMIEAAKSQFPDLKGVPTAEIQQKVADEQGKNNGPGEAEPSGKPVSDKGLESDVVRRVGSTAGLGAVALTDGGRFPAGLERFGLSFFGNSDGAGLGGNSPSLPDYILSEGDEIQVSMWGRETRSGVQVIDNEGMFHYPPLAPMRLSGMKFSTAQQLLTKELQKIQGITASISLGRLKSIRVMVLGEAARPGSFTMPAGATVTTAIFRSGGVSQIGSLRAIEVRRRGKVVAKVDLYDMLIKGVSAGDMQLLPGDVLFIPLSGPQVAITGMVKRPAIYEIKPGTKALESVDLAGGLQATAHKGRIRLDRVQANKRNIVLDVEMDKVDPKSNVRLEDGDILFVDRVLERLEDVVYLEGNVTRPGRYQYKKGMTVRDLIPGLKDLREETFFEYAHIRRPSPDDDRPTLLNFSLADVMSKGARVPLEPRDVVRIYNRYDLAARPKISILGMVRLPGDYYYSDGISVSDLIILAGGLGDAYLVEAHLRRPQFGPTGDSMYTQLIKVNLKKALDDPRSADNIELKPFDVLKIFPRSDYMFGKGVSVNGAVGRPGTVELSEGMGLPELIVAAGGLTKSSFKLTAEIVRRQVENDSVLTRTIKIVKFRDILEGRDTLALQDGDALYIRDVVRSNEYTAVNLAGQFAFPGKYEFTPGEKLSSVIRRAGGFTGTAYLRGLVFVRKSVREQQLKHAEDIGRRLEDQLQARLQQTTGEKDRALILAALERRQNLINEIRNAPYLGRVLIQLDRNYKFANTDYDVTLENGDELIVGAYPNTVSVLGEVISPVTVIHTRSTNSVGELLSRAGGVSENGDYRNSFYISPDGSIRSPQTTPWYRSFKGLAVEPGGTVVVPPKPPAKDYLEMIAKSTEILFQMAVTAGVIVALQ